MSIQNSVTGEVLRSYTIDELKQQANLMRGYDLAALCAATSGHAGGTLSIMDIAAALYLRVANHDPKNPQLARPRPHHLVGGAQGPGLYLGLGFRRLLRRRRIVALLRKLSSPFQGHPHWLKLPGVEVSSGSLGQGLSIAVGNALAARLDGTGLHRLLHHGRRRTAGGPDLGGRHGGRPVQARQSGRHCGRQPPADRRLGADVMNVEPLDERYSFRLGRDQDRRP